MPEIHLHMVAKRALAKVTTAIQQAMKEIVQRYDLKNSHSDIQLNEKDSKIVIASQDEFKLKAVNDVLEQNLVKRKVPLKGLTFGPIIPAAGSPVPHDITLQQA